MVHTVKKVVAVPGTGEPITATRVPCAWVLLQALDNNTSTVSVGDSTTDLPTFVGHVMHPGDSVMFPWVGGDNYDLGKIFVDSAIAGEGVNVTYGLR